MATLAAIPLAATADAKQPNILIIWGDDVGLWNALAGRTPSPRREFLYFNDDGSLVGLSAQPEARQLQHRRCDAVAAWLRGGRVAGGESRTGNERS